MLWGPNGLCGAIEGIIICCHGCNFISRKNASAVTQIRLEYLGCLLFKYLLNAHGVNRRSPVAIGIVVDLATRTIESTFSGRTGSSTNIG